MIEQTKDEQIKNHGYRPLPYYLEILDSPIEGQGLFLVNADRALDADYCLGISHFLLEGELQRTPLGGFINHSEAANCTLEWDKDTAYLVTEDTIEPGEELTLNYFHEIYGIEEETGKCVKAPDEKTHKCNLDGIVDEEDLDTLCCKNNPCKISEAKTSSYKINGKPVTQEEYLEAEKEFINSYSQVIDFFNEIFKD